MKLILGDAYPFPYPSHLSEDEQYEINECERGPQITLENVVLFEWRFTVTIEFVDHDAMRKAQALTGWPQWGNGAVLEATTNRKEAREFPAFIIRDKSYCQLMLEA